VEEHVLLLAKLHFNTTSSFLRLSGFSFTGRGIYGAQIATQASDFPCNQIASQTGGYVQAAVLLLFPA